MKILIKNFKTSINDLEIQPNNAQSKDIPAKGCTFMFQFPIKQQKLSVYEMGKHLMSAIHKLTAYNIH